MKYRVIETPLGPVPQYSLDEGRNWKDITGPTLDVEAAKAECEKHRKHFAPKDAVKVLWEG